MTNYKTLAGYALIPCLLTGSLVRCGAPRVNRQPYSRAEQFISLPFGNKQDELSPSAVITLYLQERPLFVTGFLSFDEKSGVCISDFRSSRQSHEELFRLFDARGKQGKVWRQSDEVASRTPHLALNADRTLWVTAFPNVVVNGQSHILHCVRKVDANGKVLLQFGEADPGAGWNTSRLSRAEKQR